MKYVATLRLPTGKSVKVAFKSRATKTGTVTTHARDAATAQGHTDFVVTRVVADLSKEA